ncbi:MAG TPA: PIN domain-containing protein [Coriobacteriia bacterium]
MRTVVLDTNVLLAQPDSLLAFPDAEVIVPDTVLQEIDKLKTARVDAELRFKGREVSRLLFDASERGALQHGVDLPGGGRLRVVSLRSDTDLPEGLSARNSDDRILAMALQACADGCERLTLVTSDLNMLLKAQTYGIEVERVEIGDSFARRYLIRPFQRYRVQLMILAVAIAVFAAVIVLTMTFAGGGRVAGVATLPAEFVDQLTLEQQQVLNYLFRLESSPKDVETQKQLAILYDQMSTQNANYIRYATKHWEKVIELDPSNVDARTDLATLYFRAGDTERAIAEVGRVLRDDPNHVNANFNLGVFYLSAKPVEYQKAANQFVKVLGLTRDKPALADAYARAQAFLAQIKTDAGNAGIPVKIDGGTL